MVSQTAVSDSTCMLLLACYCLSWGLEITSPFFLFFQKLLSLKVGFLNILSGKKKKDERERRKKSMKIA